MYYGEAFFFATYALIKYGFNDQFPFFGIPTPFSFGWIVQPKENLHRIHIHSGELEKN